MDSPDCLCLLRLCGDVPCAGGVESKRRRVWRVPQPLARSQSSAHSLRCSDGRNTALKYAILNNRVDVAAYLRSIGAPE
jgi:hypothetical protein